MSKERIEFGASTDDQLSSLLRGSAVVHEEDALANRVLVAARTKRSLGISSSAPLNVIDTLMVRMRNQLERLDTGGMGIQPKSEPEQDRINFKIQLLQKLRRHRLVEQNKAKASPDAHDRVSSVLESIGRDNIGTDTAPYTSDSQTPVNLKTLHVDWNRHGASALSDTGVSMDEDVLDLTIDEEGREARPKGSRRKMRHRTTSDSDGGSSQSSVGSSSMGVDRKTTVAAIAKRPNRRQISRAQKDRLLIGDDWDERTYNARLQKFREMEKEQEEKIRAMCEEAVHNAMEQNNSNDVTYLQSIEEQVDAEIRQQSRPHTLAGHLLVPRYIWDQLLPYQKSGIVWMWDLYRANQGGILGDEMGLGKTVQVAGLLGALEYNKLLRPTLIVCPATVIAHWVRELTTWWPPLRVYAVHESGGAMRSGLKAEQALRQVLQRVTGYGGIVLITYEGMRIHSKYLMRFRWGHVILDEGHKIRNHESGISVAAKSMASTHRLIS